MYTVEVSDTGENFFENFKIMVKKILFKEEKPNYFRGYTKEYLQTFKSD